MNLFEQNRELVFTCVQQKKSLVVSELLQSLNRPRTGVLTNLLFPANLDTPTFVSQEVPFDIALVNNGVPELRNPFRILSWSPRSNSDVTILLPSASDGMQVQFDQFSRRVDWRIVSVQIFERAPDDFPGVSFYYFEKKQRVRRTIAAIKDVDKWVFDSHGLVLPFEKPEYYKRKSIAERLNRAIIAEYLLALNYHVGREDFWETDEMATFIWLRS